MNKILKITFFVCCIIQCDMLIAQSQCGENIGVSLKVYAESPSDGDLTFPLLFDELDSNTDDDFDDLRLVDNIDEYNMMVKNICSNRLQLTNPSEAADYNDLEISVTANSAFLREAMCYYHLDQGWDYLNTTFWPSNPINNSMTIIEFNPYADQINTPVIEANIGMIEYSTSPNYKPLAEDAYPILTGLFQYVHEKVTDNGMPGISRAENEGVSFAFGNYFAHRYMVAKGNNTTSTKIFQHGGKDAEIFKWKSIDLILSEIEMAFPAADLPMYYFDNKFATSLFPQVQSELLTACLWDLALKIGNAQVDNLIISTLPSMTSDNVSTQTDAAYSLYQEALAQNYSETDLCYMLELFYSVYGDKFITTESNLTLPSAAGDIYIADNPTDIGIETPPSYYVCNSPDIWNRNIADGFANSTSQKADLRQINESGDLEDFHLNYLYIKLNGDLCDLTSAHSPDNMQLKVYYNTANGIKWPADWEHDDNDGTDDHVSGDLIGTIDLNTRNCVYDDESMDDAPLDVIKRGNHTIIQIPWRNYLNPNSAYVKKLHHDFNYLARLTSDSFDPISVVENQNVINNAQKNNNIALKKNGYYVWQPAPGPNSAGGATPGGIIPQGAGPGIILTGDPDPNDPTVRFTVRPSSHDPVPVDPDPNDTEEPEFPIRQVFNDYNDFGDIVIILDPELYQSWTTGGQRGTGFTLNADNEIVVNHRDFFIEGISLPGINVYSAIRVKFVPHGSTLPTRTAFDLVQWSVASGKQLDAVHVEVRSADEGRSSSRSSLSENQSDNISIYPNPAQDYFTITSNALASAKMDVYSVSNERMNVSYNTIDTNTTRVNIENLSAGIYFVRIQRAERIETIKFVKF